MKKISFFIRLFIGLILVYYIFNKIGFSKIYSTIINFNIWYIPLIILIFIITFIFNTFNIQILLKSLKYNVPFGKLFKYTLLSWSFGMFIPGKFGEFSLVYFLNKENIKIGHGAAISVIDKIITLVCLFLISFFGLFMFFSPLQSIRLIVISLALFAVIMILIVSKWNRNIVKKYILRKYSKKFAGFYSTFEYFFKHKKHILFIDFIITLIKWSINALIFYVIFLALKTTVSLLMVFIITSITVIISLIPITASGLGIREGIGIFLFSRIGVAFPVSSAVYIISLIIRSLIALFSIVFLKTK